MLIDNYNPRVPSRRCGWCRATHDLHKELCRKRARAMRASRFGVHVGCALGAWNPSSAFVPPSHVSHVSPNLRRAREHQVPATRLCAVSRGLTSVSAGHRPAVSVSRGVQSRSRTRHGWQSRLFMSSNQGMNPESFTERAWDAMVRLPSLADANQAQVSE